MPFGADCGCSPATGKPWGIAFTFGRCESVAVDGVPFFSVEGSRSPESLPQVTVGSKRTRLSTTSLANAVSGRSLAKA